VHDPGRPLVARAGDEARDDVIVLAGEAEAEADGVIGGAAEARLPLPEEHGIEIGHRGPV
jgi:hypothetical protein